MTHYSFLNHQKHGSQSENNDSIPGCIQIFSISQSWLPLITINPANHPHWEQVENNVFIYLKLILGLVQAPPGFRTFCIHQLFYLCESEQVGQLKNLKTQTKILFGFICIYLFIQRRINFFVRLFL